MDLVEASVASWFIHIALQLAEMKATILLYLHLKITKMNIYIICRLSLNIFPFFHSYGVPASVDAVGRSLVLSRNEQRFSKHLRSCFAAKIALNILTHGNDSIAMIRLTVILDSLDLCPRKVANEILIKLLSTSRLFFQVSPSKKRPL